MSDGLHGSREGASSHQSVRSTARVVPIIVTAMGGERPLRLR
jgi:hypothetical protein